MPKVSAKHVQRRIAELDTQYTVAQPSHYRSWWHWRENGCRLL